MFQPIRVAAVAEALRVLPALLAQELYNDLMSAEAKLTDAIDHLDAENFTKVADALQWLQGDVRALRIAAQEAAL